MGQTLSAPATEKHKKSGGDDRYSYGLCEMQGWRISMEDAHAIELKLEDDNEDSNAFFAVYDGHAGGTIARFCGDNIHKRLMKEDEYQEKQYKTALKKAFLGTDEDIRSDPQFFRDPSGCTAVAALFTHDGRIFVANAGDSRSVMSVKGEAKPLSFDHKPMDKNEVARIRKAGGYVEYGRVNGNLALSRAIGDFQFKTNYQLTPEEQIVTADPDITEHVIDGDDEFVILACDGIWDCLTSQQVVNVVRAQIAQKKELSDVCDFVCDLCLAPDTTKGAGVGCDNMTVLIIALLNGRTKEEWYDWVAERVEKNHGFETPKDPPQIYDQNRINAYRARRQALEERNSNANNNSDRDSTSRLFPASSALGFARSMLGGGVSFHPDKGLVTDEGSLMFSSVDNDYDDSEEDIEMDQAESHSFLASLGLRPPTGSSDVTNSLRAQLDELDDSDSEARFSSGDEDNHDQPRLGNSGWSEDEDVHGMGDQDDEAQQAFGTAKASQSSSEPPTDSPDSGRQGETPSPPEAGSTATPQRHETPPPVSLPNGDLAKVNQLTSSPGGDAFPSVAKVEGFIDKSDDPIKA